MLKLHDEVDVGDSDTLDVKLWLPIESGYYYLSYSHWYHGICTVHRLTNILVNPTIMMPQKVDNKIGP